MDQCYLCSVSYTHLDHIICVKGDNSIGYFGTPEEVFSGDHIKELFQIEKGTYLSDYGSVELEAVKGEPKVFVIGGNGTGTVSYTHLDVYKRQLQ